MSEEKSIELSVPSFEKKDIAPMPKRNWKRVEKKDERIILKGLREFRPMYLIAKDIGVSRNTLYKYVKEVMSIDYKDMRESMLDVAEAKLMQNIAEGNQNAIQFFLDRQGRNRGYGEKQQLERQDIPTINIGTIKINPVEKQEVIEVKESNGKESDKND